MILTDTNITAVGTIPQHPFCVLVKAMTSSFKTAAVLKLVSTAAVGARLSAFVQHVRRVFVTFTVEGPSFTLVIVVVAAV